MTPTHSRAVAAILFTLLMLLLSGCGNGYDAAPSRLFPTGSIYAYMKAVQDESGNLSTTVQLRDGPNSSDGYLYLSHDEFLYTSLNVPPQQYMNFEGDLFRNGLKLSDHLKIMEVRDIYTDYLLFVQIVYGKPEYISYDTQGSNTTPLKAFVDFERSGHVMTGESSVEIPPAFQILSPAKEASISRATPLALSWSNVDATSTMQLDVAGSCADGSRYTMSVNLGTDTGTATLNSADYFPASGISPTINCRAAFILQRVRLGGISPKFAFGSFRGIQQRTLLFTTTP